MKLSKINLPASGYSSPLLSYWTVALLSLLVVVVSLRHGVQLWPDTPSYYDAGELLFGGAIHETRTPVYPLILQTLKSLFGYGGSQYAVVLLQAVTFLISVVYLNRALRLVMPQFPRVCFWMTLLYVLYPYCNRFYIQSVLTDSFAITFSTFLVYCMVRVAQSATAWRYALLTMVWLLLLVFLRPVMMSYLPVVAMFWVALYLKHRRSAMRSCLIGIGGVVVIVALLAVYVQEMTRRYNLHSVTFVSTINNYCTVRYHGVLSPDDTDDPEFRQCLAEYIGNDSMMTTVSYEELDKVRTFPHPVMEQAVNHAIRNNVKDMILTIYLRFRYDAGVYSKVAYINKMMLFAGIFLIVYSCRRRCLPLLPWTMFLMAAAFLASMYIGTMAEWERISSPMLPMFVVVVGWTFSRLRIRAPENSPE